jgi:hypothetical protein
MDNTVTASTEAGFDISLAEIQPTGIIEKTRRIIPEIMSFISNELTDLEQYYVAQGLDFMECIDE